jgi:hypothetical protein
MNPSPTHLAPGQRYAQPGGARRDQQVTIAHLDRDTHGLPRVIFLAPDGRHLTAYATQVEAAIATGVLAPIAVPSAASRR